MKNPMKKTMSMRPKNQIPDEKTGPKIEPKTENRHRKSDFVASVSFRFVVGENRFFGAEEDFFSVDRDET